MRSVTPWNSKEMVVRVIIGETQNFQDRGKSKAMPPP